MAPDVSLLPILRRYHRLARAYGRAFGARFALHPGIIAAVMVALALLYASYRVFQPLPAGTWPELKDSVIFEYIGWFLTEGNRLYIDVWAVKPPLAFELPAILAIVAGDNVVHYHVLNLLANAGAVVLAAAAAAGIVYELTDDYLGAIMAGIGPMVLPFYVLRALIGFKAKYFVIAAGLWCLYFAYQNRSVAAGIAGVMAVGFWQLAVIFPLVALGMVWRSGDRSDVLRYLAGGLGIGVVMLLPIVLQQAIAGMIAEAVIFPLLLVENHSFIQRVQLIIRLLGKTFPLAIIGIAGIAAGLAPGRIQREWPLFIVLAWFSGQIIALDFDNLPDLFPWFALIAIGIGLVVGHWEEPTPTNSNWDDGLAAAPSGAQVFGASMALLVAISVVTMGGFGAGGAPLHALETYDTNTQLNPELGQADNDADVPSKDNVIVIERTYTENERQYVFWNRVEIPTCRAFGAQSQLKLVRAMGIADNQEWYRAECGQLRPAWRALQSKFGVR